LGNNFKLRASAFIDELTQEPFSQEMGFLISPKSDKSKQISVYQWLDKLISLQAIDNGVIDSYECYQQHGVQDSVGNDFKININDQEIFFDVKSGNSGSKNRNTITKVQHKSLTEIVADLVELYQLESSSPYQH